MHLIWPNLKLITDILSVPITLEFQRIQLKMEMLGWSQAQIWAFSWNHSTSGESKQLSNVKLVTKTSPL